MPSREAGSLPAVQRMVNPRQWARFVSSWLSRWRFDRDAQARSGKSRARFRTITISREAGAGGGSIARLVGMRLGWKVYDHELLEAIAERMQLPIDEVRAFDELAPSVIQDWFLPLGEEHYAPHEAYLDHLAKLVEAIGQAGNSIIVGRGAGFLLPREENLSVRIIAPLRARSSRLAERMGLSPSTARRAALDLDRRGRKFTRVMHRADAADPHLYDLVLNSQSLGLTIATEIIVRAIEAGTPAELISPPESAPPPDLGHKPTALGPPV